MDPITLPAGMVWLDGGKLGAAIVHGDPYYELLPGAERHEFLAPAAWTQYDKRFDPPFVLAGDSVFAQDPTSDDNGLREVDRDGRQVWTVRWLCDCDAGTNDGTHADDCPFDDDGYLSDRATIQVVPVVAKHNPEPPAPYVVVLSNDCWLIDHDNPYVLPLDPLPAPGHDFALIITLQHVATPSS